MFYVLQNESTAARRRVPILLTDAATGTTAQTGVATTTIFPYVNINGNAFIGGTGNVGEAGYGQYYYEFEVNEIATLGLAGIHITAAGCRDYDAIAQVAAFNLYGTAGAGISAGDVWNYVLSNSDTAEYNLVFAKINAEDAKNQTSDISGQVWNTDVSAFVSPSAGYDLTQAAAGVALTAGDVWDYASRTITGGIADTVQLVATPVEISYPSMAGVANTIWSTDVSGYTNPSAGYDLTQAASGAGISAYDVWAYTGGGPIGSQAEILYQTSQAANAAESNTNDIGGTVWTYAVGPRTITGGTANTVTSPVTVSTASMTGIAGTVWSTDVSGYSSPSAGFDLSNASSGAGLTAGDVWDFNITGFGGTNSAAVYVTDTNFTVGNIETYVSTQTPQDVWTYAGIEGRTITGGTADTVTTLTNPANITTSSMTGIAGTVWSVATRTITGGTATTVTNPVDITSASMSGIANTVWSTLTAPYTTHATFGHQVLRSDNAATIGEVTLHQSGGSKRVDADVHAFVNNTASATAMLNILTGIGASITSNITGNLSGSVGSVTNPVSVTTASMTGIAGTVWSTDISGYTSPSAGYDLANASAGGGISAYDVWNFDPTAMTSPQAGAILTDIQTDTNTIITDISNIPNNVWVSDVSGYTNPGEAGFELTQAAAGAGLTAGDVSVAVWDSPVASYTSSGTFGLNILRSDIAGVAGTVSLWTGGAYSGIYADTYRIDADYNAAIALKDILTGIGASITGNITGDISGSVGSVTADVNVATVSMTGIAGTVWSTDISGYTSPSAGYSLYNATGGVAVTAGDIWSYATREITGGIADTVTDVTNGVSVTTNNDKTGYSLSSTQTFDLTGNITGNLSGSVDSVTNPVIFDSAQYASIASSVWNAGTRTLTSSGSGISAFDVWNFVLSDSNTAEVDLVQAAAGSGLTAGDVWSAPSRTITGGIADTVTTLTDRSGFAITGGTITTVSDKTGYSLSSTQSFNLTGNITGNLSGSVGSVSGGVTVTTNNDKTGYALSGAGVSAVQSGLSTLTQAQVGQEVDSSLSDVGLTTTVTGRIDATVSSRLASASYVTPPTEASIAGTVWGYATRTLTSGAGASAGDVWTYATRSLTSGAGITVNAATNIINGPYFVKSNVDGQDGNLDVIRGMVQDIQLTVTDAFQNPFDVTALGLAVNFYDQAGTLVTSYGTSNLYAPAGLVQFTLDTAVTANEGRYNLILSAAGSGNTIKFGPLTTLVRPF
jgi:hypothetical protein